MGKTVANISYIGETENFKECVKDHDSKKAFWQKDFIFVLKDGDMTKADVQYLEYKTIAGAKNTFVLSEKIAIYTKHLICSVYDT